MDLIDFGPYNRILLYIFSKEKFPEKDDEYLMYEEQDIVILSTNSGLETNKVDNCPIASAAVIQSDSSSTKKIPYEITEEEYLELKSKARKFDEISGICG